MGCQPDAVRGIDVRVGRTSKPYESGELAVLYSSGVGNPPYWFFILEAAQFDPLRAQEIEERINQIWWERYLTHRAARSIADSKES